MPSKTMQALVQAISLQDCSSSISSINSNLKREKCVMGEWRKMDGGRRAKREGLVVLVAVDALKEITNYALEWAIRNVVQPKDTLIFLPLLKSTFHSGKLQLPANAASSNLNNQYSFNQFVTALLKKWGLRNDSIKKKESSLDAIISSSSSSRETNSGNGVDEEGMRQLIEVCLEMMNKLCSENKVKHVRAQVKLLPCAQINSVADKAEEYQASWVILDRCLKKETERCLRRLNCNIILIDHDLPKILKLVNAVEEEEEEEEEKAHSTDTFPVRNGSNVSSQRSSTPISWSANASSSLGFSSDQDCTASMPERELAPFKPTLQHYINIPKGQQRDKTPLSLPPGRHPQENTSKFSNHQLPAKSSDKKDTEGRLVDSASKHIQREPARHSFKDSGSGTNSTKISGDGAKQDQIMQSRWSVDSATIDCKTETKLIMQQRRFFKESNIDSASKSTPPLPISTCPTKFKRAPSIRQAMSLSIKQPIKPPPLCSVCKHKAPVFGKPPRKFSYEEMKRATNRFSTDNILGEGEYGSVYKGVLEDGQVVAVKKRKKASALGAAEFCSEVEVLSCAQHRNLVMLVGYSVEGKEWLLVYEFACNGSLDKHLHEKDGKEVMAWHQRQKVAIGAARGLRYLHEDCRVGCIVHRDLRPSNILLTHDFEPMVGDFGLARRQMDGQTPEETRIVGAMGYLAPEYIQTGQITEKADVYAFGLLLIELISGSKVIDLVRREKQHHLQWATSLIQRMRMDELVDPRLNGNYAESELSYMMHVANLCVSPDPEMRPCMSQVLRILEGDVPSDSVSHRQYQTTNPVSRSNQSHQRSQKLAPVSRSNVSHHRSKTPNPHSRPSNAASHRSSQTPNPISSSSDGASHLRSLTPPPRSSDSASHERSQTPTPISKSSDSKCDLGSQIPALASRTTQTACSTLYSKSFNSPFEQSKFVQKRYGLQNEKHNDKNMMKPMPYLQTTTTGTAEMEKLNNERIVNQDGHFTTQIYQAYLQESYFEFTRKTNRVSKS